MRQVLVAVFIFTLFSLVSGNYGGPTALGQTQTGGEASITATRVIGEVTLLDPNGRSVSLKTDAGPVVIALIDEKTSFYRAQPGAKTLDGASKVVFGDIGIGDRVLAVGRVAADQKSVPAKTLVVMSKADIAKKQDADRAEWRRRGITGTVVSVDPGQKNIVVNVRSFAGPQPITIAAADPKIIYRRYAPDSIKFSDAKPSAFEEVKIGDQLRALGDKSQDGSRFTPQEVVTGSFRTITGTVSTVETASNQITVKDIKTGQNVTVVIRPDSVLKKFPAEFAAMMAARGQGGGAGASGGGNGAQRQGEGGPPRQGGFGGGRGFDFQEMLIGCRQSLLLNSNPATP